MKFHDPITLLDAISASQISNKEFLDERYHEVRGKFGNELLRVLLNPLVGNYLPCLER